jgi:hypothetical protein
MIPVPANHAGDVIDGDQLPRLVADVLPSGDFLEHEQPHLVASIEEMPRLRIVGCAHDIALQIFAQDARVAALGAAGHGLANKRKRLMAVQAAQLDDLAVQLEAVVRELRLAKTDRAAVLIH